MAGRAHHGTALACTLAFLAPWALLSALLAMPWRVEALALLAALGALLYVAAIWSGHKADAIGLDAEGWAFATVVSGGFAMGVLLFEPKPRPRLAVLCDECGRENHVYDTFCFGCGAVGA